jgi:hypothetical protein
MLISKLFRALFLAALIMPVIVLPSSDDAAKGAAPKKSWARTLAYPALGAAAGTAAVWCWLKKQSATRTMDDFSGNLYFAGSIAGFSFGFAINKATANDSLNAGKSSKNAAHKMKKEAAQPAEPEELKNVLSTDKYYSSKMNKWVYISSQKIN